jgi:transcriptional regulator GlxA family with amidase domain
MSPPHDVVVLLADGVQLLDVAGPVDVLDAANRLGAAPPYRVRLASPAGADVRTGGGVVLRADLDLDRLTGPLGTLLVPGALPTPGTGSRVLDGRLDQAVARLAPNARRVAAVCAGSAVLAATGLLDGRRATTHWATARSFGRDFPAVRWEPDRLVVADGHVLTSAGVSAGLDLALSLVDADHGTVVAREVARWLVVFLRRPGGQSQFRSPGVVPPFADDLLRTAVDAVLRRPAADHRVETLAASVGLSPRQLSRRFVDRVSVTPARFVERVRVEAACDALERGDTVQAAARRSGFGSAEVMRRAFLRVRGVSPSDYRDRFAAAALPEAS